MSDHPWDKDRRGPMTADKLRVLAAWLDRADEAFEQLAALSGTPLAAPLGKNVQEDVRYWADCIDFGVSPIGREGG